MRLDVDLSSLWAEVDRITKDRASFSVQSNLGVRPTIDIELEGGKEIDLVDVDFSGPVASVQGRQVLLYIPDHTYNFDDAVEDPQKGKKFHVTYCKTLEEMQRKQRFERYFATNDLSGQFTITGLKNRATRAEAKVELMVCKNCLDRLNYKGASRAPALRHKVAVEFSIPEFFETYSSCFRYMPSGLSAPDTHHYSEDWSEISRSRKAQAGFCCENCRVDLSNETRLLHTHHRNGVKSDNRESNLMVLCADCHRNQPDHNHMHVPHSDTQLINRLRREQGKGPSDWEEAEELVDPALRGILDRMRSKNWPAPEIGYEIVDEKGAVVAELEAAWPASRYALVISANDKVDVGGWRVETVGEAT